MHGTRERDNSSVFSNHLEGTIAREPIVSRDRPFSRARACTPAILRFDTIRLVDDRWNATN